MKSRRRIAIGSLAIVAVIAGTLRPAVAQEVPTPDPACVWEWGGEPEVTPSPCLTPAPSEIANEGDFATRIMETCIVIVFLLAVLLVVQFARRRTT